MNIRTSEDVTGFAPPDSKWVAVDNDTYDGPGCPIGRGATEREAIDDLLEQHLQDLCKDQSGVGGLVRTDGGCLLCEADAGERGTHCPPREH